MREREARYAGGRLHNAREQHSHGTYNQASSPFCFTPQLASEPQRTQPAATRPTETDLWTAAQDGRHRGNGLYVVDGGGAAVPAGSVPRKLNCSNR